MNGRRALVLGLLLSGEAHGREVAARARKAGTSISEGTLYPLLRALETEGLLTRRTSAPRAVRGGRRCFTYEVTEAGRAVFFRETGEQLSLLLSLREECEKCEKCEKVLHEW